MTRYIFFTFKTIVFAKHIIKKSLYPLPLANYHYCVKGNAFIKKE